MTWSVMIQLHSTRTQLTQLLWLEPKALQPSGLYVIQFHTTLNKPNACPSHRLWLTLPHIMKTSTIKEEHTRASLLLRPPFQLRASRP